jgi:hypothetical protein
MLPTAVHDATCAALVEQLLLMCAEVARPLHKGCLLLTTCTLLAGEGHGGPC